ncbi:MAG: precorrin-8X methylmutase [Firmicutes bacterium]|nr:precorrin-8X methylmutase [Bacillota bacterium]
MAIIKEELGELICPPEEEAVIKRVVHATADFEFARLITIAPGAVKKAVSSLKKGSNVVTDVSMVKAGVNKRILSALGAEVKTYIGDQDVALAAKEKGITRSMMAIRKAVRDKDNRIFLIGNAPTALFELINLLRSGQAELDLIIGTPVGFVGAREAKEELAKSKFPYITVKGRKGGSPVAAAAFNAILYLIQGQWS